MYIDVADSIRCVSYLSLFALQQSPVTSHQSPDMCICMYINICTCTTSIHAHTLIHHMDTYACMTHAHIRAANTHSTVHDTRAHTGRQHTQHHRI